MVQNWHDQLSRGWCLCLRGGDRVVGCGTRGLQRSGSFLGVSCGGPVDALCCASAKVFSVDILGACVYHHGTMVCAASGCWIGPSQNLRIGPLPGDL